MLLLSARNKYQPDKERSSALTLAKDQVRDSSRNTAAFYERNPEQASNTMAEPSSLYTEDRFKFVKYSRNSASNCRNGGSDPAPHATLRVKSSVPGNLAAHN
jgi:hypothetical protein